MRKVTAYELGPWIFPDNPDTLVALFREALNDPEPNVRHDACRRLAMIDPQKYPEYVLHLRGLLNAIGNLSSKDPSRAVRREAQRAYMMLGGGDLAYVRKP